MKKKAYTGFSLLGYILFFITIATTTSVAILIFNAVRVKSDGNHQIIAITMFLCIFIASSFCMIIDILRRKIMVESPVKKILEATNRITQGDFNVHLEPIHPIDKYDEFDIIMEDLNKMTLELSRMEILRNDFVSNVSHEIKTPLAVIQNYATAIQNDEIDKETRKKYADTLILASKKITDLVSNILKLNKLENQELDLENEKINLGEMLREVILQYEDFLEKKNLQLECDIDDIIIYSSASYLEIIWNNLISNAIKFTDNGGIIKISVKKENDFSIVKISDNGCGISNEVGKYIFDKFYQGDTSHAQEGNGLGLSLVKKVIDLLGGEITVDSIVNEGTTFTVKIKGD